jgi:hypothetical protein
LSLIRAVVESWLKLQQQLQQPQPSQTFRQPHVTRKPGVEPLDLSDGGLALKELVDQIEAGRLPKPFPETEPDFGSYSASETTRRLKEKLGLKPAGGPIPQPVVSKRSPFDSLMGEPMPSTLPLYEKATIDFGYNSAGPDRSLIGAPQYLTPEQLPPPTVSKRSSYVEDYVIRESFEEFMHGTAPKPPPSPTLKDIGKVQMRKEEPYWFLE